MKRFALLYEGGFVGGLLRQCMLEHVLQLLHPHAIANKLSVLEICKPFINSLNGICDLLQNPVEKASAYDGCDLYEVPRLLFQPVYSGHEHIVDG